MPEQWTADVVGLMHLHKIKAVDLAKHMGVNPKYLSTVLNGHRNPKHAEEACRKAINEILDLKEDA